jgi:transcriptional regulator with XRE-family HTH domain
MSRTVYLTERVKAACEGPGGFGERLTCLRIARGLNMQQLAKAVKCSPSAIHQYEAGLSYPGFWKLLDIVQFFDADLCWLVGHAQLKGVSK